MKIAYRPREFRDADLDVIQRADGIASAYAAQNYTLTLRQLYYQFVARDLMPNTEQSYNRLGRLVEQGRMAGLIDWDHIVDRTRRFQSVSHWDDPADIVAAVANQFRLDKWADQHYRPEAWVEKEALIDVIEQPARRWDLTWFAARGYASASSQHAAAMRFVEYIEAGQQPLILHFGDHDPSGIDMSRDILDRINTFVEYHTGEVVEVRRLALNMAQVVQYNPPPNPAKTTDSRFQSYRELYGEQSWELDALDPPTIDALIEDEIASVIDMETWNAHVASEDEHRALLARTADRWDDVAKFLA
jgi:hypothetical protein